MYVVARLGPRKNVRCPEFRGGRFSEVANVLHKRDFQSVTGTLSALGSVSAPRSVRSGRFYCIMIIVWYCRGVTSIKSYRRQEH